MGDPARRETQENHARMRAWERFRCSLQARDLYRLCKLIERRRVPFVAAQSVGVSIWRVELPNGRLAHAAFDAETRMIRTFFPPAWGAGSTEGNPPPILRHA
jgi:hypothetical protein